MIALTKIDTASCRINRQYHSTALLISAGHTAIDLGENIMLTDRANAICLLEILREYSDSEHILPMREITSKMELIYGIKPDRRTVYSAIQLLAAIGYDKLIIPNQPDNAENGK